MKKSEKTKELAGLTREMLNILRPILGGQNLHSLLGRISVLLEHELGCGHKRDIGMKKITSRHLANLVILILGCTELNLDEMEPHTCAVIKKAHGMLKQFDQENGKGRKHR